MGNVIGILGNEYINYLYNLLNIQQEEQNFFGVQSSTQLVFLSI
jgi:hypothetical protein